ncbi:MAG: hypothetical protein HQK55_15815 [Deltaproteobacteria bacterium]|nr:hypothetical protein [Deltaproteobacteria bacterium]
MNQSVSYSYGKKRFSGSQLGQINGEVKFNAIAPYAGVGYTVGLSDDNRWKLDFDLGALYMGIPEVKIDAYNPLGLPQVQQILDRETSRIKGRANDFQWWPVICIGLSYVF